MIMTRNELTECIVESIKDVCMESELCAINDNTDPIQHLGLDSYDGVVCTSLLSDKLGFDIPTDVNLFVDDEKKRSRCISEIVDTLMQLMDNKEENLNE